MGNRLVKKKLESISHLIKINFKCTKNLNVKKWNYKNETERYTLCLCTNFATSRDSIIISKLKT